MLLDYLTSSLEHLSISVHWQNFAKWRATGIDVFIKLPPNAFRAIGNRGEMVENVVFALVVNGILTLSSTVPQTITLDEASVSNEGVSIMSIKSKAHKRIKLNSTAIPVGA